MEEIQTRHIEMLRQERDALLKQVDEMRAFINTVPTLLLSARLDAKQNKQTKFDFKHTSHLCRHI
jgi:hypothetical protein